jgi:hypothetical protein
MSDRLFALRLPSRTDFRPYAHRDTAAELPSRHAHTSRNTHKSGVSLSTSTLCELPLIVIVNAMVFSPQPTNDRWQQPGGVRPKRRSDRFIKVARWSYFLHMRSRIVFGVHVFKAKRANRRHLRHVFTGLCPMEMRRITRQDH